MKRYLTVGIISGVLIAIVVAFSWFTFPAWQNPAAGGFWALVGATIAGVLVFVQSLVSIWKDLKEEKKEDAKPISPAPIQTVDSQSADAIYNAPGGTINVYPSAVTSSKPSSEEPSFWFIPHPYPIPPNFTGRVAELKMLDDWLADNTNRLFILRALGGFGKSALAWQWINTHVGPAEWTKLVWWSFYEGDANFEHFVEETLKYLKLEIPQGQRPQVDALLKAMQSQKILLIMDGFERALRAYSSMNAAYQGDEQRPSSTLVGEGGRGEGEADCVNLNAEIFLKSVCSLPNIKSKVLLTTRLAPRTVKPRGEFMQGCREEELTAMQPADAVEFFHKQKIKGTHSEIEAACAPYGYHPLSLCLLAGHILKHFENPADIVVAHKLKIDGDIIQQKHHVLEVSYNSLQLQKQELLSTIACFRSPVELKTLRSITESKNTLDADLHDLVERGLLHFDEKNKKFDLHPIVRHYAYDRLTSTDRMGAHKRLVNYLEAVPRPEKVEKLEDLAPVIELYHHMIRAGNLDEAWKLFCDRILKTLYYQLGGYQMQIELLTALFLDGKNNPPRLKEEADQAHCLNELANAYSASGQPRHAANVCQNAVLLAEKMGDKRNIPIGLGNVAARQLAIGVLMEAERNLRRRIELCHEIEDEFNEARGHHEMGRLLSICGLWDSAKQELLTTLEIVEKERQIQPQSSIWSYHALRFLLMAREEATYDIRKSNNRYRTSAIESAQRALELADEWARTQSMPRDYVRAHWLLGAAYRANNELTLAEENLSKALKLCRQINLVESEADILLDIARLHYAQNDFKDAQEKASEALVITERSEYVLQGADVNLFLAQYALEQEKDKARAKEYAETALKLATCDGPPYYYKVAYEEAERFLENLK